MARLRLGAQAARDVNAEPPFPVAKLGDEAEIVEARKRGIRIGAGEGDLELARQQPGVGLGDEPAGERERVGAGIEDLVHADTGLGRDEDVADGIAAAAARGQTEFEQFAHGLDNLLQRDVVDLELLPRGDVDRRAAVALCDDGHGPQLRGRVRAAGGADAHHVAAVAALLVAAEGDTPHFQRGGVEFTFAMTLYIAIELFKFGGKVVRYLIRHGNSLQEAGVLDLLEDSLDHSERRAPSRRVWVNRLPWNRLPWNKHRQNAAARL
jgi:hypothetical protein